MAFPVCCGEHGRGHPLSSNRQLGGCNIDLGMHEGVHDVDATSDLVAMASCYAVGNAIVVELLSCVEN
jgi:hypothetical protein